MKLVLYDGNCGLCNRSVLFIIKRDREAQFTFASIQSDIGKKHLAHHGIDDPQLDTFYLIENDNTYERSDAATRVGKQLPGWTWLAHMASWLPKGFRDWCYDRIARNRHRFGKKNACEVVDASVRKRFLDL